MGPICQNYCWERAMKSMELCDAAVLSILAGLTILSGLLLYFDSGIGFTVILACTGIFLYSVNPIMMAAAIDATNRGTESSGVALMFTGGSLLGALSPILAGQLRQSFGMDAVFIYTTAILTVVTIGSLLVPMRRN